MLYRFLSTTLSLAGLVLLGLAAYAYFAPSVGPGLMVAESDIEVCDCAAGEETSVVVHLHNSSGQSIRVLGLVTCWGQNCRFGPKRSDDTFELPPGPSDLECSLLVQQAGVFSSQLTLYIDDQGIRRIPLTVRGEARASGTESK
jgi:hypothetical protein